MWPVQAQAQVVLGALLVFVVGVVFLFITAKFLISTIPLEKSKKCNVEFRLADMVSPGLPGACNWKMLNSV